MSPPDLRKDGPRTLFDKIWESHVIADLGGGFALIHVDRHVVHDLGARAFTRLKEEGLSVRHPELTFGSADHATFTDPGGAGGRENPFHANMAAAAEEHGFTFFAPRTPGHGIVHVITPELAIALPGMTLACGDSHTCTIGALGVVAWGVGQTEILHILATQASIQRKPKRMRIEVSGKLAPNVASKDLILHLIGRFGAGGGTGYAVEYAGETIRDMAMEARFTLCNMSVEMGARFGLIAPDDTTFDYLAGREYAPKGEMWDRAVAAWRDLGTDDGAGFDRAERVDASALQPQITWGISPEHVLGIDEAVPDPAQAGNAAERSALQAAIDYVGLVPGTPIAGTPIDRVFIGSCTNARISDLRIAAGLARGRRVASGVEAWVVPGSYAIKQEAEREGLDRVFRDAGFQWREAGCSMCGGTGGMMTERAGPGERVVSTSNRNFVGRQGPDSRTHLASPAMAVAAAVTGAIADVRKL